MVNHAYDREENIKDSNISKQYKGKNILLGGNTELFEENIYEDIKENFKRRKIESFIQ